jgi:predicted RNA methylase
MSSNPLPPNPDEPIIVEFDGGLELEFPAGTPPDVIRDASRRFHAEKVAKPHLPKGMIEADVQGAGPVRAAGAATDMDLARQGIAPAPPEGTVIGDPTPYIGRALLEPSNQAVEFMADPAAYMQKLGEIVSAPSYGLLGATSGADPTLHAPPESPLAQALERGTARAASFVPSAAAAIADLATTRGMPGETAPPPAFVGDLAATGQEMADYASGLQVTGPQTLGEIDNPDDMMGWMTNVFGEQAPIMASLMLPGAAIRGPAGILGGGAVLQTGVIGQGQMQEYGEVSGPEAVAGGVATGALEALPIMRWLRRTRHGDDAMSWVADRTKAILGQMGVEGSTEYTQAIGEALAVEFTAANRDNFSGDEWQTALRVIKETQPQAIQEGVAGAFMGKITGAARGAQAVDPQVHLRRIFAEKEKLAQIDQEMRSQRTPKPPTLDDIMAATRQKIADDRKAEDQRRQAEAEARPIETLSDEEMDAITEPDTTPQPADADIETTREPPRAEDLPKIGKGIQNQELIQRRIEEAPPWLYNYQDALYKWAEAKEGHTDATVPKIIFGDDLSPELESNLQKELEQAAEAANVVKKPEAEAAPEPVPEPEVVAPEEVAEPVVEEVAAPEPEQTAEEAENAAVAEQNEIDYNLESIQHHHDVDSLIRFRDQQSVRDGWTQEVQKAFETRLKQVRPFPPEESTVEEMLEDRQSTAEVDDLRKQLGEETKLDDMPAEDRRLYEELFEARRRVVGVEEAQPGDRVVYTDENGQERQAFVDAHENGDMILRRLGTRQKVTVPKERVTLYQKPEGAGRLPFEPKKKEDGKKKLRDRLREIEGKIDDIERLGVMRGTSQQVGTRKLTVKQKEVIRQNEIAKRQPEIDRLRRKADRIREQLGETAYIEEESAPPPKKTKAAELVEKVKGAKKAMGEAGKQYDRLEARINEWQKALDRAVEKVAERPYERVEIMRVGNAIGNWWDRIEEGPTKEAVRPLYDKLVENSIAAWKATKAQEKTTTQPELEEEKPPPITPEEYEAEFDAERLTTIADRVAKLLEGGLPLNRESLFKIADEVYGGTRAEGVYREADVYDAMETGFNRHDADIGLADYDHNPKAYVKKLNELESKLVTQTSRTEERSDMQQFSTPPALAGLASWVANINSSDVAMEPTAGTGNIVARIIDAHPQRVYANELSDHRAALLASIEDVTEAFSEDADHLYAIFHGKGIRPSVIVMNPPFSRNIRHKGKRKIGVGLKHVLEAVKLVQDGGRVVAILGGGQANAGPEGGASLTTPSYRSAWKAIEDAGGVIRANIRIPGSVYKKFGTSFNTRLAVIDKVSDAGDVVPITGEVDNLFEAIDILSEVRDARKRIDVEVPPRREARAEEGAGARSEAAPRGTRGSDADADGGGVGTARPGSEGRSPGEAVESPGDATEAGDEGVRADRQERDGSERTGEETAAEPGESPGRSAVPRDAGARRDSLNIERAKKEARPRNAEQVFDAYQPSLSIAGAKPHPTPLSESAAMSVIDAPQVDYTPNLPKNAVESGEISAAQLEAVIYAGASHEQTLANGRRAGFFVGDGTGVGKTRTIGGVIMDNWRRGRRKAVVFSPNIGLWNDFNSELKSIGFPVKDMFKLPATGETIDRDTGILYVTYNTFIRDSEKGSRMQQIIDWLGKDFDGVLAFDEAHKMGNSMESDKGGIGKQQASQTGVKGYKLQSELPKARVLYASATGATTIENLAFAQRLGLWGEGTPFASRKDFVNEMQKGGISAMEVIAQDMKRLGRYLARNLVLDVEYERLTHNLTADQEAMYDKVADAWKIIFENLNAALEATGMVETDDYGNVKSSMQATRARSHFYAQVQSFFNNLLVSMKMPTLIEAIEKDIKAGHAPVIQILHTGQAALDRVQAQGLTADELQDVELNSLGIMMNYLESSFPVYKVETFTDEETSTEMTRYVEVDGKKVEDPDAVAIRDKLLDELASLKMPELPLDQLINHFGQDIVAEATGRTARIVYNNRSRKVIEKRTKRHRQGDIDAFMSGKKKILVFSIKAAGTGSSFHANPSKGNVQLRRHYVLEAGWQADEAIQALGRTHRAGQQQPPVWILTETNLAGEKRFISTVARRLEQLGALTKGSKEASGQELYSELDNVETSWATPALHGMFNSLDSTSRQQFEQDTGLRISTDSGGVKAESGMPTIQRFMNRLLALPIDRQNELFAGFSENYELAIADAKQSGDYDNGTEVVAHDGATLVSEETVRDEDGAKTRYAHIKLRHRNNVIAFDEVIHRTTRAEGPEYIKSSKGNVYAIVAERQATDRATGQMKRQYRILAPDGSDRLIETYKISGKSWTRLEGDEAMKEWNEAARGVPTYREEDLHLVHGAILPIWDRFAGDRPQIRRVTTDDDRTFLGRVIEPRDLKPTLRRLGAGRKGVQASPDEVFSGILEDNYELELSNGWRVVRRRVHGENRVEIIGPELKWNLQLEQMGVMLERVNYKMRYFIPTGKIGSDVIARVMKNFTASDFNSPDERGVAPAGDEFADHTSDYYSFTDPLTGLIAKLSEYASKPFRARKAGTADVFIPPELRDDAAAQAVSDRMDEARLGARERKMAERAREAAKGIRQTWTSSFEHLNERDGRYDALFADILRQYRAAPQFARAVAYDSIRNITDGLSPAQVSVFTDYLALGDIIKDVENGLYDGREELPYGFSHRKLGEFYNPDPRVDIEHRFQILEKIVAAPENAAIARALEMRRDFQRRLTARLVNLKLLSDEVLRDPRYYHRQVLEYLNAMDEKWIGASGGPDAHIRKKTFQMRRAGGSDFSLAYHEAEFEYISQAIAQIAKVETLERLKGLADISKDLAAEAKQRNKDAYYMSFATKEARRRGGLVTPLDVLEEMILQPKDLDPLWPYRMRIARGFSNLAKAAANGNLPHLGFQDVVEELAYSYFQTQDAKEVSDDAAEYSGTDHPDLFKYLSALAAQEVVEGESDGTLWALSIFKAIRERETVIKRELGRNYLTWRKLAAQMDGYTTWQPKEGYHFFKATTIPERVLDAVLAGEKPLRDKDLRDVLARGTPLETWVIPEDLAATLDQWGNENWATAPDIAHQWLISSWKQWVLLNPMRALRYNVNNMSGDLDIAIAYDPKIVTQFGGDAMRDLWQYHFGAKVSPGLAKEIEEAIKLGVVDNGLTVLEIPDIKKTGAFRALVSADANPNAVQKGIETYWRGIRGATVWRENTLRLAAFRYFQKKVDEGGKVYAASNRDAIDALETDIEKAAKLARELIGDYGNISQGGQWMRRNLIPFYSWIEINAPRYVRLLKNARHEGEGSASTARAAAALGIGTAFRAGLKIGAFALKAHILFMLVNLWNKSRFPDEDRKVNTNRRQLHIILGHRKDGTIITMRFEGALADALEWFDLDDYPQDIADLYSGKKDLADMGAEAIKAPINRIVQSWEPVSKTLFEVVLGKSSFPELFEEGKSFKLRGRPIRNRLEHAARTLSMDWLVRRVSRLGDKPSPNRPSSELFEGDPGVGKVLDSILLYRTDPGEAAYWYTKHLAIEWEKKNIPGSEGVSITPTERSNALYYYRKAITWGDEKAAAAWLKKYGELGGTPTGLRRSIQMAHPLGTLTTDQTTAFLGSLSGVERREVDAGIEWYAQIYGGSSR